MAARRGGSRGVATGGWSARTRLAQRKTGPGSRFAGKSAYAGARRAVGVGREAAAQGRHVRCACSANTALGAGAPARLGIRSRLPLRMRARGSRRRGSASPRARRAENQWAGGPVEKEPISERGRREGGQWREAVV